MLFTKLGEIKLFKNTQTLELSLEYWVLGLCFFFFKAKEHKDSSQRLIPQPWYPALLAQCQVCANITKTVHHTSIIQDIFDMYFNFIGKKGKRNLI